MTAKIPTLPTIPSLPSNLTSTLPKMPDLKSLEDQKEDMQEKIKKIKPKIEKFKGKVFKAHKEVAGIAILTPRKEDKEKIYVLTLIDDSKEKTFAMRDKLVKPITKIAKEIDKNLVPEVLSFLEVRESCFDGKYEVLHEIATAYPIWDPVEFIAAIRVSEIHKSMVLKKFEKYITSYVAAGSFFRGEKANDIDVYLIVDDTDVKRMSRAELKDKLRAIIVGLSFEAAKVAGVKTQFHPQIYVLTDFWEAIRDAHPVMFTLLRDGVPFYDRGVFMPWKLLLKMGHIRPSPEAIDMHMDVGERLLTRAKRKLLNIAGEDLYYATLNPSQAALMLYGVAPPTPKETVKLLDEIFVKKEKLLEKKYVNNLDNIRKFFKDMEHGKVKNITGKQVDEILKDTEDYLKRIKKLFYQIDKKREKETMGKTYTNCVNIVRDLLKDKKTQPEKLVGKLRKYCEKNKLSLKLADTLSDVIKSNADYKAKKITRAELDRVARESSSFIRILVEHMQREKNYALDRSTIKFKYGDTNGQALILNEYAYITPDLGAKEREYQKAKIKADGSLDKLKTIDLIEFEKVINGAELPARVIVKQKTFESLKELFGDIEIMM